MGMTLAQKIISTHLVEGSMRTGEDAALRIDQTLTQDATGTMAYLALERMGVDRVRTEKSVAYVDHNTLQCGFENADDHRYIQSVAARYGVVYSRPGNGICHQVHLERFGRPGKTLVGSDSHTPTGGALCMLAMGAGGMDVAVAMAGGAYHITMPKMMKVSLTGRLSPWVTAKDVSLELLRRISVKGGVGYIIEWGGEGVRALTVPQRATIANMGAETGATTSIFPSDEQTRAFLRMQGREADYLPMESDPDAVYDETLDIDLSALEPLIACPHSPDNVKKVTEVTDVAVSQVCIGSCTNSSMQDMLHVAAILRGRRISDGVSLSVSPGSRQVLEALVKTGALNDMIMAGARILECACGPCIGMGFSPASAGVSVRTFNRCFLGRSGTRDARLYLCSPEVAAATALAGHICDPRVLGDEPSVVLPDIVPDDGGFILPPADGKQVEILRGPNIRPFPEGRILTDELCAPLLLKVGDNITTDHIMPAGAKVLPYRSNIPKMAEFCFGVYDETFPARAKAAGESIILGGVNYGQGSSREHAALAPMYLGVRAVVVKSFARIHAANLINAGILPLTLEDEEDYERLHQGDTLRLTGILSGLGSGRMTLTDETNGAKVTVRCDVTPRQAAMLRAGGLMKAMQEAGK